MSCRPASTYFLLLASATGAMAWPASGDLVTLLVALETVSLPAFALVGLPAATGAAPRPR